MLFRRKLHLLGESDSNAAPLPLQSDSAVEKMICDPGFAYMKPWFYSHPYALRCELGIGDSDREYMNNAYKRAPEIFDTIFRGKPDAMMFDYLNECIFSVYDDRGCDVVFATKAKMAEFFEKLKPYLLEYDMETMLKRIAD